MSSTTNQWLFAAVLSLVCLAVQTSAQVPVNGHEVTPIETTGLPQLEPSTQGDSLSVANPDEVFSGSMDGLVLVAGDDSGVATEGAAVNPNGVEQAGANPTGRKLLISAFGRKMLQVGTLELSGSGVSAGDSTVGASANAFGHGDLNGVDDTHIEPHGVDASASVAGEETHGEVTADPDCVAGEGPCVTAGSG
ncbi:hypothetical protein WJX77_008106 [Trebouxia sp. C0004]